MGRLICIDLINRAIRSAAELPETDMACNESLAGIDQSMPLGAWKKVPKSGALPA